MPLELAHDALEMTEYGDEPSILVFADSDSGFERARRAVELAGCRLSGTAALADAWERLDQQVAMDAAYVDAVQDGGALLDRLLDRLNVAAARGASEASSPRPRRLSTR